VKLSEVIAIWDLLQRKNMHGQLDFCDLEKAVDKVIGVENDISP